MYLAIATVFAPASAQDAGPEASTAAASAASQPWEDEPAPTWDASHAEFLLLVAVDRIVVRPTGIGSDQLDDPDYTYLVRAMADDFGMVLQPIGVLPNLGYYQFRLRYKISYVEAEKRCHRMVRYGSADDCRSLSPSGGLL